MTRAVTAGATVCRAGELGGVAAVNEQVRPKGAARPKARPPVGVPQVRRLIYVCSRTSISVNACSRSLGASEGAAQRPPRRPPLRCPPRLVGTEELVLSEAAAMGSF